MKEPNIHTKTIINKSWNQVEARFDHSFGFAFQTKAEYLDFRLCWKANYAALSQSIRGLKALVKATMRKHAYAGKEQGELHVFAVEATVQLLMLKAAKLEANRQYVAEKEVAK